MSIPVQVSIAECACVALARSAAALEAARTIEEFVGALSRCHEVCRTLVDIADHLPWSEEDRGAVESVWAAISRAGGTMSDDRVEALIRVASGLAVCLAPRRDVAAVERRVRLAWRESECQPGRSRDLESWLTEEICRRVRRRVRIDEGQDPRGAATVPAGAEAFG